MKIESDSGTILSQDKSVRISHTEDGVKRGVTFPITLYKQDYFKSDETFSSINSYWAQLPQADQDEIFRIYENIRELFDSVNGIKELNDELKVYVANLMAFHSAPDVERWIRTTSGLEVPKSVQQEYSFDVDKNTTRDQTYIYSDYLGLMSLSVILRAMIPIWAVYNKTIRSDSGKSSKDTHSFQLLEKSSIYKCEPMERLRRYIQANLNKSSHTGNHTLELLCSDDMPEINLALVCVRKLCLGELRVDDPKQNLAALVYNYIVDRPPPQGQDFSKRVLEKKIPTEGGGESGENNGSTLELYKARSTVTVGRIAEMEYAWKDPHNLARYLCPEYVPSHLDRALETTQELYTHTVHPCMLTLAQWVLAPVFPPMGLFYMDTNLILRAFAVTETVLRGRGFKSLALLSSAYSLDDEDEGMRVTPVGSKSHIGAEIQERMLGPFPYAREQRKRTATPVRTCFVTEDIKDLSSKFLEHTWRATADIELVTEVLRTSSVRRIPIPPNLRSELALMLLDAEERFE